MSQNIVVIGRVFAATTPVVLEGKQWQISTLLLMFLPAIESFKGKVSKECEEFPFVAPLQPGARLSHSKIQLKVEEELCYTMEQMRHTLTTTIK